MRPRLPLTWIGGRVRWEVRQGEDGDKYLAKKTVLPTPKDPNNKLGTRSFVWMGPIDLSNYTIQADVLLTEDRWPPSGRRRDQWPVPAHDSRYEQEAAARHLDHQRLPHACRSRFRAGAGRLVHAQAHRCGRSRPGNCPRKDLATRTSPSRATGQSRWSTTRPICKARPACYGNTPRRRSVPGQRACDAELDHCSHAAPPFSGRACSARFARASPAAKCSRRYESCKKGHFDNV